MNIKKDHWILPTIISGLLLLIDQLFKYLARANQAVSYYLIKPWLGWEYLGNKGVAFGLPFPNAVLIIITPLIILGLIILLLRKKQPSIAFALAIFLIIAGALSNLIDRLVFSVTIDYIRILTGVINLADGLIVIGAVILILQEIKRPQKTRVVILDF